LKSSSTLKSDFIGQITGIWENTEKKTWKLEEKQGEHRPETVEDKKFKTKKKRKKTPRNLRDAAFCSASSSLAMLRFGGVATGAVASSVAEGVAQAFKASVQKGQELRRGQGWHFCSYPRRISLYIYIYIYVYIYISI